MRNRTYRVVWEIDIEASSPREAAEQARAVQQNPGNWAGVFECTPRRGKTTRVDLDMEVAP